MFKKLQCRHLNSLLCCYYCLLVVSAVARDEVSTLFSTLEFLLCFYIVYIWAARHRRWKSNWGYVTKKIIHNQNNNNNNLHNIKFLNHKSKVCVCVGFLFVIKWSTEHNKSKVTLILLFLWWWCWGEMVETGDMGI